MSDNLRPYSEYKASGVDWIGNIPLHWKIEKVKRLFQHKKQLNRSGENTNVLSLTLRGVVNNDPDSPEGLVPKDYATYQIFDKDNLVFKLIDLENLRTSRVGLVHENGIMSSAYIRLILQTSDNIRYFYHQFYDLYLRGVYNNLGAGVRSTLGQNDLLNLAILVPPPDEQDAIVRFLDVAEKRIQRYIRAKQKLIKLLNEQKQAIIQQAVTRGLNPDAPMKDSGIEWLGDIPSHWKTVRLAHVIDLKPGYAFRSSEFTQNDSDTRLLRGINVSPNGIRWNSIVYWAGEISDYIRDFELQVGDIVMGMDRPVINSGIRVALVKENDVPSLLLQRVARIRPNKSLNRHFLMFLLGGKSFSDYLAPIFTGISVPHVSREQIESFRVAIPPIEEQEKIVDFVSEQTKSSDEVLETMKKEIGLIREYQTRLIADVVTGKVNVSGLVFKMPEEFDDDDLLDVDEDDLLEEDEFEEVIDAE
jgi:type I restriction enzyme S subunit